MGVSDAKFCDESHGGVLFCVGPPKPSKFCKNMISGPIFFSLGRLAGRFFFSGEVADLFFLGRSAARFFASGSPRIIYFFPWGFAVTICL